MSELIIAEKPNAAKNIASALADGKAEKINLNGVPYYSIRHDGKSIIVACAVGHLYTVAPIKKSYNYPQFDTKWTETSNVDKKAAYSKKYVKTLKELSKKATEFTVATDYDIEGEVIGVNVIKHICKQKDANRMKFSTLTKGDLVEAYQNKQKSIDWGQANAGLTRHELDWYYGINLSSALMSAVKAAGSFKVLSSGRVQGPALKLLCDKELEIKEFKPEPFWQIQLLGKISSAGIEAWHVEDKIFDLKRADEIISKTKNPKAKIRKKEVTQFKQQPPFPFDLTSFQVECYRVHKISPKETLSIAQELYTSGYISYPRTSSQKLPAKLGYNKLLSALAQNPKYSTLAKKLLSKKILKPNEGPKEDDAHPAIYPTGIAPGDINERSMKVYDLVVRRFLATFGDHAVRETVKAIIDVNKEDFICKGTTTKEKGWHEFYGTYATYDETVLPLFDEGDLVDVDSINKLDKETQPPKRYTQASIIKELDKRNLGTKATRAQIIDSLYNRGYVNNKSMEVTDLGLKTCEILQKYSPEILDEELTRKFEDELEKIRKKKMTPEEVLKEAQEVLTKLLKDFKTKEKKIGEELKQAQYDSKDAADTIGPCPNCGKGSLKIRKGKFGNFIGCDAYPDCKTIISLPKNVQYQTTKKVGEGGWPVIKIKSGKIWKEVSVNAKDDGTNNEDDVGTSTTEKKYPEEGMKCPNCKDGKMILRKSFYGEFLGCNNYPKCKTMMKIVDGKVNTSIITKNSKK
ncbi:MAG: DNA topoisomerase I [Candidatus Woesearchaeota archaeon]